MKKAALTIFLCLSALMSAAQTADKNKSTYGLLERTSIGINANQVVTSFRFSGFLKGNPSRALEATASVRIWQHLEVGGYMTLMGASPFASSGGGNYGDRTLYHLEWSDNNYHLAGGAYIELHSVSLNRQKQSRLYTDLVARGGFGLNGMTDGFWGGVGAELGFTPQVRLVTNFDFGAFPMGHASEVVGNQTSSRVSVGLKINLK